MASLGFSGASISCYPQASLSSLLSEDGETEGKAIAKVAVARKLLKTIYHLLREEERTSISLGQARCGVMVQWGPKNLIEQSKATAGLYVRDTYG